jgi:hypothetical protein
VRLDDFRSMVERMAGEVPAEYLEGIAEVRVSPKTVPHPALAGVWTLGECIPIDPHGDPVQSRLVLYHGSFAALARDQSDFDWREEAWETLTHELRHHLEWLAEAPDLEAYDWAADQNFHRHDGEPFDPLFFEAGERVAPAVTRIDDDVFLDHVLSRRAWRAAAGRHYRFTWRGASYDVALPTAIAPVTFVVVDGVDEPPPGELIVVVRRRSGLRDLFRRRSPPLEVPALARRTPLEEPRSES